jgi:hypothetical protein
MIHHRLCSLKAFRSIFPEALTPIRANKSASFRFIHASYVAAPGFLQESGDGRTDGRTHLLGIASTIKHPPVILLYGDTYSIYQHIRTSAISSSQPPSNHVERETPAHRATELTCLFTQPTTSCSNFAFPPVTCSSSSFPSITTPARGTTNALGISVTPSCALTPMTPASDTSGWERRRLSSSAGATVFFVVRWGGRRGFLNVSFVPMEAGDGASVLYLDTP